MHITGLKQHKVIKEDMGVNYGKKNDIDKRINCENYSLKINAENFNDHFINIANNISDKIKSDNTGCGKLTSFFIFYMLYCLRRIIK
jgi:hypothetical protein